MPEFTAEKIETQKIGKKAKMFKKKEFSVSKRAVIAMSLLIGVGFTVPEPSYAGGCGTYCQAKEARAICHDIVKAKGLRSHQRDAEFEKCRADVMKSKQIEQLADDAETSIK